MPGAGPWTSPPGWGFRVCALSVASVGRLCVVSAGPWELGAWVSALERDSGGPLRPGPQQVAWSVQDAGWVCEWGRLPFSSLSLLPAVALTLTLGLCASPSVGGGFTCVYLGE